MTEWTIAALQDAIADTERLLSRLNGMLEQLSAVDRQDGARQQEEVNA